MTNGTSLIAKLLTWMVVGLLAIVALKLAFWVAGMAMGLGFALLFTVGPIILVGWLFVKLFRFFTRDDEYRDA